MAAVAFVIPLFESLEGFGLLHCQEIGVSVVSSLEIIGLFFLLKVNRANRSDDKLDWTEPLTIATGWGGAELFANNIMYFIWGNETDTKWMYLQEALNLNIVFLEIICVCVFVYSYARARPANDSKSPSPIGNYIVVLLFRYLCPAIIKVLKTEEILNSWFAIGARTGTAAVFYLLAKAC